MLTKRDFASGWWALAVWMLYASSTSAHQLWVETGTAGRVGESQTIHVCWGQPGFRESGENLEKHGSKLSACWARPGQQREALALTPGSDSYTAAVTPGGAGYHMVGGEIQVGILTREFHGIAANTRLVMYGKSYTRVGDGEKGLDTRLGADLEIVPTTGLGNLRPGDLVGARVLLNGKPIGGRQVELSLNTMGQQSFAGEQRVFGLKWNVKTYPDPATGEAVFPLIVPGQHVFYLQYMDEAAGRYDGDLRFTTEYSQLSKGSQYERTLYIATFTFDVQGDTRAKRAGRD